MLGETGSSNSFLSSGVCASAAPINDQEPGAWYESRSDGPVAC